ncbi:MAG: glycine zipper 2TM domain-containing protein [Betaproteobacteria bacterium]|nr:glycine zipper 2TM domain-containing protein [Betaproteobacteria bacterium]
MQTVANKSPHVLTWIVGISVILFCVAGIAALMGWIPKSFGGSPDGPAGGVLSTAPGSFVAPKVHKAPAPALAMENVVTRTRCVDCGVIESTRVIDTPGDSSPLGVVGGAVLGGVLGNQVGGGRGKDLATVAGAVGGAMAGNEIEKRMKSGRRYETTVRFEDGTTRVFGEANLPQWRAGDRVKVIDGVIRLQG